VRYFLEQCLLSVQAGTIAIDAEIIVVDNASADDSIAMIRANFPEVKLILNKENRGFSKGNNQGVAIAQGEYLCVLNPDTVVAENTFSELISYAEGIGDFGILGVRLVDGAGNFLAESKRNIPTPRTSFAKMFGLKVGKTKGYYADDLAPDATGEVPILVGAFMFMKRETYTGVGGFDEDYFMYGEDIDLSFKMLKAGLKNFYLGKLLIIHYKGESTVRDQAYLERFYGAMQLFYHKHFRSTIFYDALISLGIKVFSFMQSFKKEIRSDHEISSYYLISDNVDLCEKIQKCVAKEVVMTTLDGLGTATYGTREIIFDNELLSFSEIIGAILRFKNTSTTFKIRPKACNFVIGSNRSDYRGAIIPFKTILVGKK